MADLAERVTVLEQKVSALDGRLTTSEGQFDFISRQLRDLHLFTHGKFEQIDRQFEQISHRFEQVDRRLDRIEAKVDAIPRAIIEALREERGT